MPKDLRVITLQLSKSDRFDAVGMVQIAVDNNDPQTKIRAEDFIEDIEDVFEIRRIDPQGYTYPTIAERKTHS